MDREGKFGIILIIIGICIPLMTIPFLSGYSKDKGMLDNLYQAGIELSKGNQGETGNQAPVKIATPQRKSPDFPKLIPKRIPFRFFLVITVILMYMGIVRIDASIRRKNNTPFERHG